MFPGPTSAPLQRSMTFYHSDKHPRFLLRQSFQFQWTWVRFRFLSADIAQILAATSWSNFPFSIDDKGCSRQKCHAFFFSAQAALGQLTSTFFPKVELR